MNRIKRISMVQTIGVVLILAALTAVFTFWIPLAQKSFSVPSIAQCVSPPQAPEIFHLHKPGDFNHYKNPNVAPGCGEVHTYKLFF